MREVFLAIRVARDRERAALIARIGQAWWTANLANRAIQGKLTPLDSLIDSLHLRPAQSGQDMRAAVLEVARAIPGIKVTKRTKRGKVLPS